MVKKFYLGDSVSGFHFTGSDLAQARPGHAHLGVSSDVMLHKIINAKFLVKSISCMAQRVIFKASLRQHVPGF